MLDPRKRKAGFFVAWSGDAPSDIMEYTRKEWTAVTIQTVMQCFVIVTHFR